MPYRAASKLLNSTEVVRREGFEMLSTISRIYAMPKGEPQIVSFRNLHHPINVRPGTNDLDTVLDTVVRQEYGKYLPTGDVKTLIDAGAFIGDTSAWFLTRFPQLRTWALEPNPDNFQMVTRNLASYGSHATTLPCALASQAGKVQFSGDATGGSISSDGVEVETITIPQLLAQIPGNRADVLKIDIEGGELDVFTNGAEDWLDKVGLIIVELHGPEITRAVSDVLHRNGFTMLQYRSIWYCSKERPFTKSNARRTS